MLADVDGHRSAGTEHRVHFFDDDAGLAAAVHDDLSPALRAGATALIIAAPEHRTLFRKAIVDAGIDLEAAERSGRLQILDAAELLERFCHRGVIDPVAFEDVIGGTLRAAASLGRPVRAYGEMVALLWADGDVTGAMELERLWNDLGAQLDFALLCAYPAEMFRDPSVARAFGEICSLHSAVFAGPPAPAADVVRRLPDTAQAPRLAREFVTATLRGWLLDGALLDDALMVVTELVTNAVLHASSSVAVGLTRAADGVSVSVADSSADPPTMQHRSLDAPNGRGLAMVAAIARTWGHHAVPGGKVVWAELAAQPEGVVKP